MVTKTILTQDGWTHAQWKAEGLLNRLGDQVHNLPMPYLGSDGTLTRERRKATRKTYAELRKLMGLLLSVEVR